MAHSCGCATKRADPTRSPNHPRQIAFLLRFGFKAVDKQVSIHDLHATVLRLMGLDHEKLTYRYAGRDFRLTDVFGRVVKEIFA